MSNRLQSSLQCWLQWSTEWTPERFLYKRGGELRMLTRRDQRLGQTIPVDLAIPDVVDGETVFQLCECYDQQFGHCRCRLLR